jgi:DNA-binding HxlR family transcriptional regulator
MARADSVTGGGKFNCPVEIPVGVLGGKWKLVLIYHLLAGPRRNGELCRLVPGITQKMLTQQLRELERDGIVIRTVHREVPPKVVYTIDPGEAKPLQTLTKAMCDWANYWASRTGAEIRYPAAAVTAPRLR